MHFLAIILDWFIKKPIHLYDLAFPIYIPVYAILLLSGYKRKEVINKLTKLSTIGSKVIDGLPVL